MFTKQNANSRAKMLLLIIGLVIGGLIVVACAAPASAPAPAPQPAAPQPPAPTVAAPTTAPAKKTTLRLPEAAKIVNTMDPGVTSGGAGLEEIQNMFEGLVYVDQITGEIKSGQAEKWSLS